MTKGLVALNAAQDHFESLVSQLPSVLGDDIGTVTTSASTESTAFPTGLLRLDQLQYIDPGTSRPAWDLLPIHETGGHSIYRFPPILATSATSEGKPRAYYTDGSNIYWDPLPSGTHTVRYYGFSAAADITAGGTFAYPDIVMLPLATFAAKLMRLGVDDDIGDLTGVALETMGPVVESLGNFQRTGARTVHTSMAVRGRWW